jgi:malonyl-CoA O-methyltransferase
VATLDAPGELASEIYGFVSAAGLLGPAVSQPEQLAKREVADSFSRAAQLYDSVAQLQRDVGEQLLARLDALAITPDSVLDLGCGTGYFCAGLKQRFPQADYYGLDIAQGMIEYARESQPRAQGWLVGDAEALPLANNSVDLVFSSLAIQWCYRPQLLFGELARVLRPGGHCVFSSLGPGTLKELRAAWAAVDKHQHVNDFLPSDVLAAAAEEVPGVKLSLQSGQFCMQYQSVRDLLGELKTLGAHNMNHHRLTGLTSRRALQGMLQAYEEWREQGLLPATYDVIFGVVQQ